MRFLVTGASGVLGGYLLRVLGEQGRAVTAWSGSRTGQALGVPLRPVDLTDPDRVAFAFRQEPPDVILHLAALARTGECQQDPHRARRVNVDGCTALLDLAGQMKTRLLYVSSDLVFDGSKGWYREQDPPAPLSTYGRTKRAAEELVQAVPYGVIARVSLLFGPTLTGRVGFFDEQLAALRERRPARFFVDEWRTPLSLLTAARALVALAESDFTGLIHLGGPERLSRLEMGQRTAALLGLDASAIVPVTRDSVPAPEPRPRDTSLDSGLWRGLFPRQPWPCYEEALREMAL
jgi:dTDP-4-dehydrorhamnose reductase